MIFPALLAAFPARALGGGETVVLVHGIASIPISMTYLERALAAQGYSTVNLGYPSTELPIQEAADLVRSSLEAIPGQGTIHLVGHSLGNIVLRMALSRPLKRLGRMVMVAPPNQGSFAADALKDLHLYRWIFGPAGQQLSVDNSAFFAALPVPPCPFGIIAGGKGDGEGFNPLLPGDDDGTVRVSETRLDGAADFILLPDTHTLILFDSETARQVVSFLKSGRFEKRTGNRGPGAGTKETGAEG